MYIYINIDISYENFCELSLLLATKIFIVIDKDNALTNADIEKDLTSMRYFYMVNYCQYVNYITFPFELTRIIAKNSRIARR